MADQYGNVIPVPSFSQGTEVKPDEILKSTVGFTQIGVTLAAGQGVIPAGYALGRVTATKKYKVYDNTADDGTEVCRGVLRQAVDTTNGDALGNMVVAGILKNSALSGVDANAITDLNGRTDTTRDLFKF